MFPSNRETKNQGMGNFNFYIDESCHLEHDKCKVMCIGYIKVEDINVQSLKNSLKEIKAKHGILHELKWNTISNTKIEMYKEIIDFFFSSSLEFRCLLVKYKDNLDHEAYNQGSHDNFYYKMIFHLLSNVWLNPNSENYRVFLDIKDTKGREKLNVIENVFESKYHGNTPFKSFQHIRSHEVQFIQLVDIFIGAVTYKARGLCNVVNGSAAKRELVRYIEEKSGFCIDEGTEPWETKFNIFDHKSRKKI